MNLVKELMSYVFALLDEHVISYEVIVFKKVTKLSESFVLPCAKVDDVLPSRKSGQIVVYLQGVGDNLVILLSFHQAVRVVDITDF